MSSAEGVFLKWAGGKRRLLSQLTSRVPSEFGTYFEPFVGGGSLLFALQPNDAVAADTNPELLNCYRVVQAEVDELIDSLAEHRNTEDYFLAVRAENVERLNPVQRASRFIYLNRTAFNGLYRVNRSGQFNVPFGRYVNPNLIPEAALRAANKVLQCVTLKENDYWQAIADAKAGDFIYLDPPYWPASQYSDFRRYGASQFREEHHIELMTRFRELDARGCFVMLSNADVQPVRDMLTGFNVHSVDVHRSISAKSAGRGSVRELIVTNYD